MNHSGHMAILPARMLDDAAIREDHTLLLVYACLSTYADFEGICQPRLNTLSQRTGRSQDTIRRAITKLRELGYLQKTERFDPNTGAQLTNIYKLIYDREIPDYRKAYSHPPLHGCQSPPSTGATPPPSTGATPRYVLKTTHTQQSACALVDYVFSDEVRAYAKGLGFSADRIDPELQAIRDLWATQPDKAPKEGSTAAFIEASARRLLNHQAQRLKLKPVDSSKGLAGGEGGKNQNNASNPPQKSIADGCEAWAQVWQKTRDILRGEFEPATYSAIFKKLRLLSVTGNRIEVETPNLDLVRGYTAQLNRAWCAAAGIDAAEIALTGLGKATPPLNATTERKNYDHNSNDAFGYENAQRGRQTNKIRHSAIEVSQLVAGAASRLRQPRSH